MDFLSLTRFAAGSFAPDSLSMSAGPLGELGFAVEDGRATGTGVAPTGETREIDVELPEGVLIDGMQEVALAVHDFDALDELTLRVLPVSGEIQSVSVERTGTGEVEVPAGTFEAYRVEVGGQQPQTLWVSASRPHIVLKREASGPGGRTVEIMLEETSR